MIQNLIYLVFKGLRFRPIRSWLTVLGVVIGITLVVVILALSSGIKGAVSKTLQMFGSDLVVIMPGKETNPFLGFVGGQKFNEKDLLDLRQISGVRLVVPMEIATLNVEFQGEKKAVMFHSQPWREYRVIAEESQAMRLVQGKWPENDDVSEVILGYRAAFKLFKNPVRSGDEIIVKGKRFKVAGIFSELGLQDEDNQIWMSIKSFQALTSRRGLAASAIVKIERGANIEFIATQIKFQLEKQEVVSDFSVLTPAKANRLVGDVLSIIEFVLMAIALISLVIGGVGIMNTMYTSVLERRKQIGVMKAIGASSDSILSMFIIESGVIGLIGGIIGVLLGLTIAYFAGLIATRYGIERLFSFPSIDFFGISVILIITFIAGILSGILPARQAARLEPAEALRYE